MRRETERRPVELAQRVDDVARPLLVVGRDGVLEVEHDTSAPRRGAFSSMRTLLPGTASSERCSRVAVGCMKVSRSRRAAWQGE